MSMGVHTSPLPSKAVGSQVGSQRRCEARSCAGTWKIARGTVKDRVISTVDPETRHMHKSRSLYRDGYKAHIVVNPKRGSSRRVISLQPTSVTDLSVLNS